MKKLFVVFAVLGSALFTSFGLVACGGGDDSGGGESSDGGGQQGGILKGTYASFPDYMDPQLSYTAEGWTAMGEVYIPLLTYKHAEGAEGSEVVPGLAEDLPKITNGGRVGRFPVRKMPDRSSSKRRFAPSPPAC